jgi:hypothetical protein
MSDAHTPNRWLVVAGALIVQVSLGAVYIWSVLQTPLLGVFPGWSEAQVTLPAPIVIATDALATQLFQLGEYHMAFLAAGAICLAAAGQPLAVRAPHAPRTDPARRGGMRPTSIRPIDQGSEPA